MARRARNAGCGRYWQDFDICERQKPTQTRPWRFRSRMAGVLCEPPFAELVANIRVSVTALIAGFLPATRARLQPTGYLPKYDSARTTLSRRSDFSEAAGQQIKMTDYCGPAHNPEQSITE
jgi:hypothetical protein